MFTLTKFVKKSAHLVKTENKEKKKQKQNENEIIFLTKMIHFSLMIIY